MSLALSQKISFRPGSWKLFLQDNRSSLTNFACIITCLTQMNRKCPQCNSQNDPSRELTKEALASKLIRELKKDDRVKPLMDEFKESYDEYSATLSRFKKDIRNFVETHAQELCLEDKRKYMMKCISEIQTTSRAIARQKGTQYQGALTPMHDIVTGKQIGRAHV